MSNRVANTDRIELVETQNLTLALNRLDDGCYDGDRWRRALVHAIGMSNLRMPREVKQKIREALNQP